MKPERDEPKYLISAIAKILDIHPQTLRNYERSGLIKPSRSDGNTRLYSEDDIDDIRRVITLTRELGVNIAGTEIILRLKREIESMQAEFKTLIRYIQEELCRSDEELRNRFESILIKSPYKTVIHIEKRSDDKETS
ncbi:helix-turn-helix transcriptional regulator [bacterium]|nr:helix-turn-helix transcriptional regulator [candidate division CSSED10-310 bacterium]